MSIRDVYIVDAVRTPIGKFAGALSPVRPDDLAAHVVRALVERAPDLDPARIDDVYFGDANGAGEDNRDVARMAVLLAGLPVSIPGVTVNRLCGSGLEAVIQAYRAIALGDASIAVAGGVESMSRAPWVIQKPEGAFPAAHQQMHSTTLGWRMTNPRMPKEWTVPLGEGAELIADKHGISRERQDAYAARAATARRRPPGTRALRRRGRPVSGHWTAAGRMHPPGLHHGGAGQTQAGLPRGRQRHRRKRLPPQ